MKKTPWFPAKVKPARKGFYERNYGTADLTSMCDFWDGSRWLLGLSDGSADIPASPDNRPWRGLAKKP